MPPSRQVLDALPGRAFHFLRAIGLSRTIFSLLAVEHYAPAIHEEGVRLLDAVAGRVPPPLHGDDDSMAVASALGVLDEWNQQELPRLVDALRRHHERVAHEIADSLVGKTAPKEIQKRYQSPARVAVFLERVAALAAGSAEEQAALATLESRGLTASGRARLSASLKAVAHPKTKSSARPGQPLEAIVRGDAMVDERARRALHAWFDEWSSIARRAIDRKDLLVRLGLAERAHKAWAPKVTARAQVARSCRRASLQCRGASSRCRRASSRCRRVKRACRSRPQGSTPSRPTKSQRASPSSGGVD